MNRSDQDARTADTSFARWIEPSPCHVRAGLALLLFDLVVPVLCFGFWNVPWVTSIATGLRTIIRWLVVLMALRRWCSRAAFKCSLTRLTRLVVATVVYACTAFFMLQGARILNEVLQPRRTSVFWQYAESIITSFEVYLSGSDLLALLVIHPVFEELLYRKWLIGCGIRSTSKPVTWCVSVVAFSLSHVFLWGPIWVERSMNGNFIYVMIVGGVLGALYVRTLDVGRPIHAHIVHNVLAYAMYVFIV